MNIRGFEFLINNAKVNIKNEIENYIDFMKVIGNNHKHNFYNQLSIYKTRKYATACCEHRLWNSRFNRQVILGEKGIPSLKEENGKIIVVNIFDVTQTYSEDNQDFNLWEFDKNTGKEVIEKISGIKNEDTLEENINSLIQERVIKTGDILVKDLKVREEDVMNLLYFLEESLKISIYQRLELKHIFKHIFNIRILEEGFNNLQLSGFNRVGSFLSNLNKEILINIQNYQAKEIEIRYNKEEGVKKDAFRRNIRGRFEVWKERRAIRVRGHLSDGREDVRNNNEAVKQEGHSFLRKGEIEISSKERGRQTLVSTIGSLYEEGINLSSDGNRRLGNGVHRTGEIEDDGSLGNNGRTQGERSNEVGRSYEQLEYDFEKNGSRGDSLHIEVDDESTSFFFFFSPKDNPKELLPKDILENISKIYDADSLKLSDKIVHAVYFIPFENNFAWYMTEYDKENSSAFGLIVGNEAKWGHFNIDELKNLGAERLVLGDSPKSFKELYDSELSERLKQEEIHELFNGEFDYKFNIEHRRKEGRIVTLEDFERNYDEAFEMIRQEKIRNGKLKLLLNEIENQDKQVSHEERKDLSKHDEFNEIDDVFDENKTELKEYRELSKENLMDAQYEKLEDFEENYDESSETLRQEKIRSGKSKSISDEIEDETGFKRVEKLKDNINAIKILNELKTQDRQATYEERKALSKYVGFGGIADVFDENKTELKEYREVLKENLTDIQYEKLRESTLTSFYTPKFIMDAMYKFLEKAGFDGGNILEPSCGTGRFISSILKSMENSKFYGVEIETISGNISKYLYPNANIEVKGFEETNFSNNFFDVAIGNVPFGNFKINDR